MLPAKVMGSIAGVVLAFIGGTVVVGGAVVAAGVAAPVDGQFLVLKSLRIAAHCSFWAEGIVQVISEALGSPEAVEYDSNPDAGLVPPDGTPSPATPGGSTNETRSWTDPAPESVGDPFSHLMTSPAGAAAGHGESWPVWLPTYGISGHEASNTHPWHAPVK